MYFWLINQSYLTAKYSFLYLFSNSGTFLSTFELTMGHCFLYLSLSFSLCFRPFYIVSKISREIRSIKEYAGLFTPRERQAMQKYVDDLSGCIGSSERIVQTPGTVQYSTLNFVQYRTVNFVQYNNTWLARCLTDQLMI